MTTAMLWFFLREDAHSSRLASNFLKAILRRSFTGWTILQWLQTFLAQGRMVLQEGHVLHVLPGILKDYLIYKDTDKPNRQINKTD